MLIIVGENKKRAFLRCVFTGWYYEIFISAQDKIIPKGLSIKTERTLNEIVNASERAAGGYRSRDSYRS
jgi:hypothetical protein